MMNSKNMGGIFCGEEFYYVVKRPENYDENKKYPILFAFHGIGHHEEFTWNNFDGVTDMYLNFLKRDMA